MPNMKDLSLRIKKLWPMLKFFDGQTDGQTDRVITIGHPPSGGALNIVAAFPGMHVSPAKHSYA